ncbi:MAG: hypothetical protein HYT80_07375 [Euryarchaeota archaeon]|nr:hypothetical protein [Euryarchaeota archaeon]
MAQFKCPQCSTLINAEPGQEARCLNCGFRAMVPAAGTPSTPSAPAPTPMAAPPPPGTGAPPPPPDPRAQGPVMPLAKSTAAWGFLLSMVGLGTFFLAPVGIPFIFGLGGVALGIVAFAKNRADRRGLIASVLGAVALVAALAFLLAY